MMVDVAHQRIQRAGYLARIARHFRHALFMIVQFFQRDHGQIDIVFFKTEQR